MQTRLCRKLFVSIPVLTAFLGASPVRADSFSGEDDSHRWTHSEETTREPAKDLLGNEIGTKTVTTIRDQRWLKGNEDRGEVLLSDATTTRTRTDTFDGTTDQKNVSDVRRRDEFNLNLPADVFHTEMTVKTRATGVNTSTSEQTATSFLQMHSTNPDDAEKPFSFHASAHQEVKFNQRGDAMHPIGDEVVQGGWTWHDVPGGPWASEYTRTTSWTQDSKVARLDVSYSAPFMQGLAVKLTPAEGLTNAGQPVPQNQVQDIINQIRVGESTFLVVFPDGVDQYSVPSFLVDALGLWDMA